MKIIVCVDIKNGLLFHNRRQSQDKKAREKIKEITDILYMNEYSYQLYKDIFEDAIVDNDFLNHVKDDYCLVENVSIKNYENEIDEMILLNWNRQYPADFYLDIDLGKFICVYEEEFEGSSHEKITLRKYRR